MKSRIKALNSLILKETGERSVELRMLAELEQVRTKKEAELTSQKCKFTDHQMQIREGRSNGDIIDPVTENYLRKQMLCMKQDIDEQTSTLTNAQCECDKQKKKLASTQYTLRVLERKKHKLGQELRYSELFMEYKETDEMVLNRINIRDVTHDN